ncbi:MAG: hypothetical protein JXP36_20335 [Bacteroidales bacterium]|nr:hypothetical protein [Bacteroidales bacterium]
MSGIAGMIALGNKPANVSLNSFESFFSPIMVNNCTQKSIKKISDNAIVGIGELSFYDLKNYASNDSLFHLFVWGDVYINDTPYLTNKAKYRNIEELYYLNGANIHSQLSGTYQIFIADLKENHYFLFNSNSAMLPMYYFLSGNLLLFSSRLESFFRLQNLSWKIDPIAMTHYLMFGYALGHQSFLKSVYQLPAASLISGTKKWVIDKYDSHDWLLNKPILNYKDGTDLLDELFEQAIRKITYGQTKIGLSITGGWDGRLILSYLRDLKTSPTLLYTYGKESHIDMKIARKLSERFNYQHTPIFLDQSFVKQYEQLAIESVLLSDGLKASNRGHYVLMAKKLSQQTPLIISGNCGSNILKIVQTPGAVYSQNLFRIFQAGTDKEIIDIYKDFRRNNPWIMASISNDEFLHSVKESEIIFNSELETSKRFYHFLITNIERKYFGQEAATYASYLYNYTPFMDIEFLKGVIKTPFYGGHYPFLEKNPSVRVHLSKLYADLMTKRDKQLASFTSDRGFPITWFNSLVGRGAGLVVKKMMSNWGYVKDSDSYSHIAGMKTIQNSWTENTKLFDFNKVRNWDDTFVRAISWTKWSKEHLNN